MAELLEVLVLRMENCEQQQQEVSQLRTQVTKLQQCCQLVRRGVRGAHSSSHGPVRPKASFSCPYLLELSAQPGPKILSKSESELGETSESSPHPVPSSQERDQGVPGTRPYDPRPPAPPPHTYLAYSM